MATRGSISGLRRLAFTPSPDSTALRVTSDPVPAVVGMADAGQPGPGDRSPPTDDLEVLQRVAHR